MAGRLGGDTVRHFVVSLLLSFTTACALVAQLCLLKPSFIAVRMQPPRRLEPAPLNLTPPLLGPSLNQATLPPATPSMTIPPPAVDQQAAIDASMEAGDDRLTRELLQAQIRLHPDDDRALTDLAWLTPRVALADASGRDGLAPEAEALLLSAVASNANNQRAIRLLLEDSELKNPGAPLHSPVVGRLAELQASGHGASALAEALGNLYRQHGQMQQAALFYRQALEAQPAARELLQEKLAETLATGGQTFADGG